MKTIKIEIKNKESRKSKISYLTVQMVKVEKSEKKSFLINEDDIRNFVFQKV